MTKALGLIAFAGLLTACAGTTSEVRLVGQFTPEVPPPAEVRVLLDPHYGHANCNRHTEDELAALQAERHYTSLFPDESGHFASHAVPVERGFAYRASRRPTFFLAFFNEQDTFYAVGEQFSAFQYRTFDAATKQESPREDACWRIRQGRYRAAGRGVSELVLFLAPNYDSPKQCLPSGRFTPGSFGPYKPFED